MENERQENYTIAEGYRLPSGGEIYNVSVNPNIELRSMTARDELKRQNPSSSSFKVLADIIEGCLLEKPAIHVYDMALGDYEYLLHKLRVVTYGPSYHVTVGCPFCGETFDTDYDLDDLEVKEFNKDEYDAARTFTLPKSNRTVTIKIQSPHLLDIIDAKAKDFKRKYKNAEINFDTFALLTTMIESVDGQEISAFQVENFVNTLPAMDMTKILNQIDKANRMIGIDTKVIVDCPHCGGDVTTFFRFGQEFFRPQNI